MSDYKAASHNNLSQTGVELKNIGFTALKILPPLEDIPPPSYTGKPNNFLHRKKKARAVLYGSSPCLFTTYLPKFS
jgi:hypothetical protein